MIELKNFGTITDTAARRAKEPFGDRRRMEIPVEYYDLNKAGRAAIAKAISEENKSEGNGEVPYIGKGDLHIVIWYDRECNVHDKIRLSIEQKTHPHFVGRSYGCYISLDEQERETLKRELVSPFVGKCKAEHLRMRENVILNMPSFGKITEESIESLTCDFSDSFSCYNVIMMDIHPDCLVDWYKSLAASHIKSDIEMELEETPDFDITADDYNVILTVRINDENMTAEVVLHIENTLIGEFIAEIPVLLTDDEWAEFLYEIVVERTDYAFNLGTKTAYSISLERTQDGTEGKDAVNY